MMASSEVSEDDEDNGVFKTKNYGYIVSGVILLMLGIYLLLRGMVLFIIWFIGFSLKAIVLIISIMLLTLLIFA